MSTKTFYVLPLLVALGHTPITQADSEIHWGYEDQIQLPNGWGSINDSHAPAPFNYPYAECALGTKQTPIDISQPTTTFAANKLSFQWPAFRADFFNTGHAIQVQPNDQYYGNHGIAEYAGQTRIGNESYPLLQMHFHSPSEHRIKGKTYAAELHFVHVRSDDHLAVIGVMIEIGKANIELEKVLDNMPNTPEIATHHPSLQMFDPNRLRPSGRHLNIYSYSGSLTTPPCTEGVSWYVYEKPISISLHQLRRLQAFYVDNNRQLMPTRSIHQFRN